MTEFQMKSQTKVNIILFGQVQSGKSQALQAILQSDQINILFQNNEQFIRPGTLFNKQENLIEIIESKGMIIDFDSQSDQNQYNIQILQQLDELIKNNWNNKVDLLILCIPLNDKLDEINRNLIKILEIYNQQKVKTCVMITKCEQIEKSQRQSYEMFWKQQALDKKLQIFFIQNNQNKEFEEEFETFINDQISQQKFYFWNNLNENQKTSIQQNFNIARQKISFFSKLCPFIG